MRGAKLRNILYKLVHPIMLIFYPAYHTRVYISTNLKTYVSNIFTKLFLLLFSSGARGAGQCRRHNITHNNIQHNDIQQNHI